MPLQPQTIDIPFKAGLDQSTDKHADPSGFLQLENAVWLGEGAIRQRHGFRDVSTSFVNGLDARGPQLVESGAGLRFVPHTPQVKPVGRLSADGTNLAFQDCAVVTRADGTLVVVSVVTGDPTRPYVTISTPSGQVLVTLRPEVLGLTVANAKVEAVDTHKFFVVGTDTATTWRGYIFDVDDAITTLGASAVLVTGVTTNDILDVTGDGAGRFWMGYIEAGLAKVRPYLSDGSAGVAETVGSGATYTPEFIVVEWRPTYDEVWVALWAVGEQLATVECDDLGAQQNYAVHPGAIHDMGDGDSVGLSWAPDGAGLLLINRNKTYDGDSAATQRAAGGPHTLEVWTIAASNAVTPVDWGQSGADATLVPNFRALTRGFVSRAPSFGSNSTSFDYQWYVVGKVGHNAGDNQALYGSELQYPNAVVVRLTGAVPSDGAVEAYVTYDDVGGEVFQNPNLRGARMLEGDTTSTLTVVVTPVALSATEDYAAVSVVDSAPLEARATAAVSGIGVVAGSYPFLNTVAFPSNWRPWFAEPFIPVISATGAGLTGTYRYRLRYEAIDHAGNIWLSPLSQSASISLTNQAVSLTYQKNPLQGVNDEGFGIDFNILVYRTEANSTVYKLLGRRSTSDATTFTDSTADASLGEILDDATVDAAPIPPMSHVWSHRNRLFGVRADIDSQVVYTTEFTRPNTPRWNSVLTLSSINEHGPLRAGASMDDKLVLFHETGAFYTSGFGPDNTGANGSFGIPELIPGSTGVDYANRASVVTTDAGVMFRHAAGIGLVSRKMVVDLAFGEPVRDVIAGLNVRRAVWLPSLRQTWFLLEDSAGVPQTTLVVYDCRFRRWLTFTLDHRASDVVEYQGRVYLTAQSTYAGNPTFFVFQYDTSTYADYRRSPSTGAGPTEVYVEPSITTPWLRGGGRGAMARVWRVVVSGRWQSRRDLEVTTYTQDAQRSLKVSETADNTLLEVSTHLGTSVGEQFEADFRPLKQRCSAMKLRLRLAEPSEGGGDPDTEGLVLTNVRILYGAEQPRGKTAKKTQTKP